VTHCRYLVLVSVDAVDESAEFAVINEEGLFVAVAEAAFGVGGFVFREKPARCKAKV
jgi:hypothetical protein